MSFSGRAPGGATAAWTPALPTTSGGVLPKHWYKSDTDVYIDAARTTPVASDGDVVGNWGDLTANADHISQGTTGNKPTWQSGAGDLLNGHPVIRGDGIDDWLRGAFTTGGSMAQPNTIFVVCQLDAAQVNDGANHSIFGGDDAANRHSLLQYAVPNPDAWALYAGAASAIPGGVSESNWNIWCCLFNGASSVAWKNGVSNITGDPGAHALDGLTAFARYDGTANNWKGNVTEILIYEPNLSTADMNQLGTYAATRYSLSWTAIP